MQIEQTPLVRKLSSFTRLGSNDMTYLERLLSHPRTVHGHKELVREGTSDHDCYILLRGWACCYKVLRDGRRQIINFQVSGDFLGLRSFLLRSWDHSIATVTPAEISPVSQREMLHIIHDMPRLGRAVLWTVSRDEAIVAEHLASIGRRRALERTAHLLIELEERLKFVGLNSEKGFECPLTQDELGDALGLSAIHVNRVFRQLRERGFVSVAGRRIVVHDLKRLKALAAFDEHYLDQVAKPR